MLGNVMLLNRERKFSFNIFQLTQSVEAIVTAWQVCAQLLFIVDFV